MQGRKSGRTVKHFLNGMARADLRSSYHPYGIGDLDKDSYYAVRLNRIGVFSTTAMRE